MIRVMMLARFAVILGALWFLTVRESAAIEITMNLVQSQSTITFNGGYASNPLIPQDDATFPTPGTIDGDPTRPSNQTTLQGTITVDVDNVLAPTTIRIVSANMAGDINGSWLPENQLDGGGLSSDNPADPAEPANLGVKLVFFGTDVAYGAVRDLNYNLATEVDPDPFDEVETYDPVTESVNAQGEFSSLTQHLFYNSGLFDTWQDPALDDDRDRDDLTGDGAPNQHDVDATVDPPILTPKVNAPKSTYLVSGNLATLTIPLDIDIFDNLTTDLSGLFVATYTITPAGVPGDYNSNGTVDAADYVVWRNGDSPDDSQTGYNLWKANFGKTSGSGSAVGTSAVPEPATALLVLIGMVGLSMKRCRFTIHN